MRRSARRTWSAFRIRRAARTSRPSWSRSRPSPPTSSWPTAAPGSRATRSRATSGSGARTSCPRRRAARWTSPRCAPRRRAWSEPPATLPDPRQRGDVLALPAEGVADAIDEVVVAIGVLAQQVPGAEPGVAAREGVAHELPLARRAVGVAVVLHGAADLAEELARLARRAGDAEAVRTAYECAAGEAERRA